MNEDYDFDSYLEEIMNAVYGEEVRGSIRSALEILYGMLQDAERGVMDIRDQAQQWADTASDNAALAYEYAMQAMATTPDGYDTFALAMTDVMASIPIPQDDIDFLFVEGGLQEDTGWEIVTDDPASGGTSSEDPTSGSQIGDDNNQEGNGEP